jgi:hypothetical protein
MVDVCEDIMSGGYDDALDDIIEAAQRRRKTVSESLVRMAEEGDKMRIKPGILNKRYLDGAECEVAETPIGRTTRITVQFPDTMPRAHDPYGKYAGKRVIMPAVALELVTDGS